MSSTPVTAANDAHPPAALQVGTIALHRLPVQLRMLVRLMGEAAAYRLVQWRGGTPYTVPKGPHGRLFAQLVEVVGLEPALALVAELPGHTLQLPKYDGVLRQLRHQRVIELRLRGCKHADIALATGYTVRQVINVCNLARLPDGTLCGAGAQMDMFGTAASDAAPDAATGADSGPSAHNPFNARPGAGRP